MNRIQSVRHFQIALKNGIIQNWGLVEFNTAEEAQATMDALNGHSLQGHKIRVQFCIPKIHAINIYMNFVNNPMEVRWALWRQCRCTMEKLNCPALNVLFI